MNVDNKGAEEGGALDKYLPVIWLATGLIMALVGGIIKARAVIQLPELFEYIFFSGPAYVLMAAGLLIMILAIGHGLLFGEED